MITEQGNTISFYAMYIKDQVGATGLTVTIDVWEKEKGQAPAEIVTAGNAVEIGDGLYYYQLASGSVDVEGEYIAVFKTADTDVDQRDIAALWVIDRRVVANTDQIEGADATDQIRDAVVDDATRIDASILNTLSSHDPGSTLAASSELGSLSNLDVAVSTRTTLGAGAVTWVYTLTTPGAVPISNAEVWVSTDVSQVNIIASGTTDALGVVTFYLDAGTYYFWRQKPGWDFDNPDIEVVA